MIKDNLVMLFIVVWIVLVAGISIYEIFYYKDSCKVERCAP